MKNKIDLLLEKRKIELGFMMNEMEEDLEASYKQILKGYRQIFVLDIAQGLWALAGVVCFWLITYPAHGWMWYIAWSGTILGTSTIILRGIRGFQNHRRFIKEHDQWLKAHKKMMKAAGIPGIDTPIPKSAPVEKVVN